MCQRFRGTQLENESVKYASRAFRTRRLPARGCYVVLRRAGSLSAVQRYESKSFPAVELLILILSERLLL